MECINNNIKFYWTGWDTNNSYSNGQLASAIANGDFYKPHFVKKLIIRQILVLKKFTSIDKENFEVIIDGMVDVVERGTARIAKIKNINVAGKTGTVENFILIEEKKN